MFKGIVIFGCIALSFDKHSRFFKILFGALVVVLVVLPFRGCLNHKFYDPIKINKQVLTEEQQPIWMLMEGGQQLSGMILHSKCALVRAVIISFPGRFGHMLHEENYEPICHIPSHPYTVVTFDYPGYGESGGTPSRENLHQAAIAFINYVMKLFPDKEIVILAHSLGGNVAIAAVAEGKFIRPIRALVTEGTFSEYVSAGNHAIFQGWCYSLAWCLATNEYSAKDYIGRLPNDLHLLIVHSKQDPRVPFSEYKALHHQFSERYKTKFMARDSSEHLSMGKPENIGELIAYYDTVLGK